ncbi:hypothetical protein U1Q18_035159 [Sarracenia purpurea var. burkii]
MTQEEKDRGLGCELASFYKLLQETSGDTNIPSSSSFTSFSQGNLAASIALALRGTMRLWSCCYAVVT